MEWSFNFFSANLKFVSKPTKVKELNSKYDFKHLSRLLKRLKEYKNSLKSEESEKKMCTSDEESGSGASYSPSFNEYIVRELREGSFHIKGKVHNYYAKVDESIPESENANMNNLKFELRLIVKDDECEYNLVFQKVNLDLLEKFNKLIKYSKIFAIGFKADIRDDILVLKPGGQMRSQNGQNGNGCPANTHSRIFIDQSEFNDGDVLLNFNEPIRLIYEIEKKKYVENKKLNQSRLAFNPNGSNGFPHNFDNKNNFSSLFSSQELNNDLNRLNNCIAQSEEFPDISELLIKDVEFSVYGMTNISRINSTLIKKDVFGMVRAVKSEEKLDSFELVSLKDSNFIKVLYYNKREPLNLQDNMVISIKNTILKVNKNFDFYLENPDPNSIKIYDILNEEEAGKIKKFRFTKNKDFGCLIELTKPVLNRTVQKYLITIKKIYKIMAINEKDSYVISGFPDLRLIAKILVDDGSFEAQVYLHDQTVVNLMRIDKTTLTQIKTFSELSCNAVIYEKMHAFKVFPKYYFDNIYVEQFIVYGVPFSNVAKKHFYDNNYNRYFENLGQQNNMKNRAQNMTFINGDIIFEKFQSENFTLTPRPFLRALHIESLK